MKTSPAKTCKDPKHNGAKELMFTVHSVDGVERCVACHRREMDARQLKAANDAIAHGGKNYVAR